jgi:non-ribosomal peptide synthetase component E (peptide arylation enzyme)
MRVEQAIDRAATLHPEGITLVHGERRWTYRELAERDRRAALWSR